MFAKLKAIAYFFRTIPPHHKYTGPSRRGDFNLPPRTAFDYVAQRHDLDFSKFKASRVYSGAFISAEQSFINIDVDTRFFENLFKDLITFEYFKNQWLLCSVYCYQDKLVTAFDFIFETVIDFLLVPCAIVILGLNIGLNYLNIQMEKNRL